MKRPPRTIGMMIATVALVVVGALPAAAATTVALWHMDESSGHMIDSSGSGNGGTLQNINRVSPGFQGKGRAYSFNGTNSRVIVGSSAGLNPGAKNITVTVHVRTSVRPPASVGDYDLIRKGSGIYKMEIFGTGQGFCQFQGTGGRVFMKAGPNLTDGRWHTIACRKTASKITLTVDGTSWSKNGTVGSISSGASLIIGGKPNASGDWFKGVMDEVSIVTG